LQAFFNKKRDYALHKCWPENGLDLTAAPFFYFLRLAFFLGFVGLMSETFRIMSSKRDGWLGGFVFTF
jgi:hypothetical protein